MFFKSQIDNQQTEVWGCFRASSYSSSKVYTFKKKMFLTSVNFAFEYISEVLLTF